MRVHFIPTRMSPLFPLRSSPNTCTKGRTHGSFQISISFPSWQALRVDAADIQTTRKDSESSTASSTFSSLAQYVLQPSPTSTAAPPTLRPPTLPPLRASVSGSFLQPPIRSLSAGFIPPSPFNSIKINNNGIHHEKPLPPLPPPTTTVVPPATPITADKPSFPLLSNPTPSDNLAIAVNVHTKVVDETSSTLPEPSVSATPYERAVPPAPLTASPEPPATTTSDKQRPAPLQSVLPLANQPYGYTPPAGQKSLPPLSPPVESPPTTSTAVPTSFPSKLHSLTTSHSMAETNVPVMKYTDPVYEYISGARRRSVDTGGLALALKASEEDGDGIFGLNRGVNLAFTWGAGAGWGWSGWDDELGEGPL